jgi:hypothetical protein
MKLIAAFVAALLLVPTAAWADNESKSGWADNESKPRWADDGSTSRRINIQGMITAVDFQRSVIRVQEENGRRWLVLVRADTEIVFENHNDNDEEGDFPTAGLDSLQLGDMVGIKGLRVGNRRILALTLLIESQQQGVGVFLPQQRVVRGVVVAISNRSFTLVLQDRTVTVVVQSTTQFIAHQRPATPWALAKYAVVQVRGEDLGDQILADAVEVEFPAREGVVLTGTVGGLWFPGGMFLLADRQVWVSFTSSTFVIQGQSVVPLESVQPHASLIVYGVNRSAGTQAMVIVVR